MKLLPFRPGLTASQAFVAVRHTRIREQAVEKLHSDAEAPVLGTDEEHSDGSQSLGAIDGLIG